MSDPEPQTSSPPPPHPRYDWEIESDTESTGGLIVYGADEFVALNLPEREYILEPFFRQKNVGMLFANRGTGKTLVAMGMALAVSSGGRFLRWNAPKARRVLYVDAELPAQTLQKRIRDVAAASSLAVTENLQIIAFDVQKPETPFPNIAEPEGQAQLQAAIEWTDPALVVFDNISTLCRSGEENAAESYQPIQNWLITLRSRGHSVLVLHHTGKTGDQRGTSKREDTLDFSLKLERPKNYGAEQGARFTVAFSKNPRDDYGPGIASFEASLNETWTVTSPGLGKAEAVVGSLDTPKPFTELAEAISGHSDVTTRTAASWIKKAQEAGLIDKQDGLYLRRETP